MLLKAAKASRSSKTPKRFNERPILQLAVVLGGCVPVFAGAAGVLFGPAMIAHGAKDISLDSHFRYLSGLLLGIGIAFWTTVPAIEKKTARFQLLSIIVVIGGIGRLYALMVEGVPVNGMLFGLCMELIVVPGLAVWQAQIARRNKT